MCMMVSTACFNFAGCMASCLCPLYSFAVVVGMAAGAGDSCRRTLLGHPAPKNAASRLNLVLGADILVEEGPLHVWLLSP